MGKEVYDLEVWALFININFRTFNERNYELVTRKTDAQYSPLLRFVK